MVEAALLRTDFLAAPDVSENFGMATADKTDTITITKTISMRVNPTSRFLINSTFK